MSDALVGKTETQTTETTSDGETQQTQSEDTSVTDGKEENAISWMVDDNTAGEGERPDWLKEKYKSVFDQAKAYVDLEKVKPLQNAPETYDLNVLPEGHVLDIESDAMKEWVDLKKEQKASEGQVQKELLFINKYMSDMQNAMATNVDAEIEKLGGKEKHQQKRELLENTIYNILDKDSADALCKSITNADSFNAYAKFIDHFKETPVAPMTPKKAVDMSYLEMSKDAFMNKVIREDHEKLKNNKEFYLDFHRKCAEIDAKNGINPK